MPLASFIGLQGAYFVKLGYIKQGKLHLSAFDKTSENFALVSAERDKFMVEIPVARLYLPQQLAFGVFTISQQPARSDIVGKDSKQQGILAIVLEHHQTLHQVCPKQGIRLPFRHRRRKAFSLLQLMTISDIGSILEPV